LATDLASFTQQSLNPDPEVTELPFELTASVMPTFSYSNAKESTDRHATPSTASRGTKDAKAVFSRRK